MIIYVLKNNSLYYFRVSVMLGENRYNIRFTKPCSTISIKTNAGDIISPHNGNNNIELSPSILPLSKDVYAIFIASSSNIRHGSIPRVGVVISVKYSIEEISCVMAKLTTRVEAVNCHRSLLRKSEEAMLSHIISGEKTHISELLSISLKTVYSYKYNALMKIGVCKVSDIMPIHRHAFSQR